MAACDEVFELRSLALESLFSVISDSPVRKYAVTMILEYPVYSASEFDEQVIAHDVSILDAIFPRPIDTTDFAKYSIILKMSVSRRELIGLPPFQRVIRIAHTDFIPH